MRETLLGFHHPHGLRFQPTDAPNDLVAELTLYDVEYRGVFLWFVPIKSYDIYRLRARIDEPSKRVLLQDERETYLKSWTNVRHDYFKGVYELKKEFDRLWGRRADGSLGELYRFSFDVEEMKAPVRDLIAREGWSVDETRLP